MKVTVLLLILGGIGCKPYCEHSHTPWSETFIVGSKAYQHRDCMVCGTKEYREIITDRSHGVSPYINDVTVNGNGKSLVEVGK